MAVFEVFTIFLLEMFLKLFPGGSYHHLIIFFSTFSAKLPFHKLKIQKPEFNKLERVQDSNKHMVYCGVCKRSRACLNGDVAGENTYMRTVDEDAVQKKMTVHV